MSEQELRKRLRDAPVPDAAAAEQRSWRVVSEAYGSRTRVGHRPRPLRVALAVLASLALLAVALTPAGAQVGDWIAEIVEPGRRDAQPALTSLPAPGRVLVESESGVWVVDETGTKRRLGAYEHASWSPGGLFVVVTRDRQLSALEPGGELRWSLSRPRAVDDPRWAPSGFRIAYRSGDALRVVAGDGTADRLVAPTVDAIAPAWRPVSEPALARHPNGLGTHALAFVDHGRVTVLDADSERELWSAGAGSEPRSLAWTSDGEVLLAGGERRVRGFDSGGAAVMREAADPGLRLSALAPRPGAREYAVAEVEVEAGTPGRARTRVSLRSIAGGEAERELFSGPGRISQLTWSPDGSWLLLGWRDADQWLFLPVDEPGERRRVLAFDGIGREFDPASRGPAAFPRVAGWCCPG